MLPQEILNVEILPVQLLLLYAKVYLFLGLFLILF